MTGIDSHNVVGKSVACLLSVPPAAVPLPQDTLVEQAAPEGAPSSDKQPTSPEMYGLAAAAASGRAEASRQMQKDLTLDRLIATSGFGHFHIVHVSSKLHQMVGKNVTVIKNSSSAAQAPRQDESSNDTSLTSSSDEVQRPKPISCLVSIAPVCSSSTAIGHGVGVGNQSDAHKAKRPKHHHHHGGDQDSQKKAAAQSEMPSQHRKCHAPELVSHFVIQLQPQSGEGGKNGSMESLSSKSFGVEANLLGLGNQAEASQEAANNAASANAQERGSAAAQEANAQGGNESDVNEHLSAVG